VGAGVVAGEEIARDLLDGHREREGYVPQQDNYSPDNNASYDANSNMGGNDFGISDSSSGWDDSGSSSDSGGGSDWS
jgi:hypothetical protein